MEKPDQLRSYRVSRTSFEVQIDNPDEDLELVVPLDNYRVFLYFDSGIIRVIDAKQNGKILNGQGTKVPDFKDAESPDVIRCPFVYDDDRICYINTVKQKLEWFNTATFQFENLFESKVPTLQGINENDRQDAEKIESLLRDGSSILYLKQTGIIVLMENKSSYLQNDQSVVLTAFHKDSPEFKYQVNMQQHLQKMLYLNPINYTDSVAVWGQSFSDQPVELTIWKLGAEPQNVKLSDNLNGNNYDIFPWDEGKVAIFGNYNQGNFPYMKLFDPTQPSPIQEETTDLGLFGQGDDNAWCMTDFYLCDYRQQKVIWERKSEKGTFLDVYNPNFNQITFSEEIIEDEENDNGELNKIPSPNGKYLLGYSEDVGDSEDGQPKKYPFVVNSVVSVGASLLHILKKSELFDKYGEQFSQQVIELLLKK